MAKEYVTKTILLQFAKPIVLQAQQVHDVEDAVRHAERNLTGRFGIRVTDYIILPDGEIVLKLEIPAESASNFSPGNRLRGISTWLIRHSDDYKQYRVGNRLLNYVDVSKLVSNALAMLEGKTNYTQEEFMDLVWSAYASKVDGGCAMSMRLTETA